MSKLLTFWLMLTKERISWFDILLFAIISTIPSLILSLIPW